MLKRAHWFGIAGAIAISALSALSFTGCQTTCSSSDECGDSDFCSMAVGVCTSSNAVGFCKPQPESCPAVAALVCGCDGKTYTNTCEASRARQSVASQGACSVSCGGTSKAKCPSGTYCKYDDGVCGATTATGVCEAKPAATSCASAALAPVCGCDLTTYDSLCDAEAAGVSVLAAGACACGGPKETECEAGRFCDWAIGTCGAPQPAGTCARVPKKCSEFSSAVCGCDQVTYENACEAAKAKMPVWDTKGCDCGGATGVDCPDGFYCQYAMVGNCLNGTTSGTCAKIPDVTVCTETMGQDVCGCDGKTYKSICFAAAQGTSVATNAACGM